MRNLISGIVGLSFGGMILLGCLLNGLQGEGAYYAGQVCGMITGVLFFFGGAVYLVLGLRELQPEAPRRKRRQRHDDEYEPRPRKRRRPRWHDDD
jgi:hypothetical protein